MSRSSRAFPSTPMTKAAGFPCLVMSTRSCCASSIHSERHAFASRTATTFIGSPPSPFFLFAGQLERSMASRMRLLSAARSSMISVTASAPMRIVNIVTTIVVSQFGTGDRLHGRVVGHFAHRAGRGGKDAPEPAAFPTGHAPAGRVGENRRALRAPRSLTVVPAVAFHARHPSPRTGTPPSPGLAVRLNATVEPRRRDRLPEERRERKHTTTNPELPLYHYAFALERRPFSALVSCCPDQSPGLNSLGRLFAKRTPRPTAAGPTPGRIGSHKQTHHYPSQV